NPAATSKFTVAATPTTVTVGSDIAFEVTAKDAYNNTTPTYSGTAHFSTTDSKAIVPTNAVLFSGTRTFHMSVKSVGSQTLTATDTLNTTIAATSNPISVAAFTVQPLSVADPTLISSP